MYLRTTSQTRKDGTVVRYLQLAHNVWNAEKGRADATVLYNFGREDAQTRDMLERLVRSIGRYLHPGEAEVPAPSLPDFTFTESRPLGGAYVLDALWQSWRGCSARAWESEHGRPCRTWTARSRYRPLIRKWSTSGFTGRRIPPGSVDSWRTGGIQRPRGSMTTAMLSSTATVKEWLPRRTPVRRASSPPGGSPARVRVSLGRGASCC